MWFVERVLRFNQERAAIAALAAERWIENIRWRLDAAMVRVDADLIVGAVVRPVTLTYPDVFPFAPPSVKPRERAERWSAHQYGAGGELCLEHRPDNWEEHVTGADALRSAYRLLSTEAGAGEQPDAPREVPSAHRLTLGQSLRVEPWRLVQTESLADAVGKAWEPRAIKVRFSVTARTIVAFVVKAFDAQGVEWRDPTLPEPMAKWASGAGFALALPADDPKLQQLDAAVAGGARALRALVVGDERPFESSETLLLALPSGLRAFEVDPADNTASEYAIVPPDPGERAAPGRDALAEKRVAIVGAGSMGSKVAASLARAGVAKFLLIDDDVLAAENMARHELDWMAVGAHKGDALAERLKLLRPGAEVDVRRQRLGGQESSGSLHGVLEALGKCDLIVDASGSDTAFNYAASVAAEQKKPMVWGRVFGGGYGGMIARSRPGMDPAALDARAAINHWCANPEFPDPPKTVADYGAEGPDGQPMIADDADVAHIAASVTRMALDVSLAGSASAFEHSAYMIGLRKEWIFRAAFDTWPIDLGAPRPARAAEVSQEDWKEATEAIMGMLPKASND